MPSYRYLVFWFRNDASTAVDYDVRVGYRLELVGWTGGEILAVELKAIDFHHGSRPEVRVSLSAAPSTTL